MALAEDRLQALQLSKANRDEVPSADGFAKANAALESRVRDRVEQTEGETRALVARMVDVRKLKDVEDTVSRRIGNVENAVLKGLKAVSEKAAAALGQKAPLHVRV